jgi:hypothetical protein
MLAVEKRQQCRDAGFSVIDRNHSRSSSGVASCAVNGRTARRRFAHQVRLRSWMVLTNE